MAKREPQYKRTKLRDWREWSGINLADFAVAMDMNEGYLSDVEMGHRPYNQKILDKAEKILKVPAAHILAMAPPAKADERRDYSDPAVVASELDKLDEKERRRIGAMIRGFITGQ